MGTLLIASANSPHHITTVVCGRIERPVSNRGRTKSETHRDRHETTKSIMNERNIYDSADQRVKRDNTWDRVK